LAAIIVGCGRAGTSSSELLDDFSYESTSKTEKEEDTVSEANNVNAAAEDFLGQWEYTKNDEYIMLAIVELDGEYQAAVSWNESTGMTKEWEYTLKYKDGKLVCDSSGVKSEINESKLAAQGDVIDLSDIMKTTPNQTAEFYMTSEGICWNNLSEGSAKDIVFKFLQDVG